MKLNFTVLENFKQPKYTNSVATKTTVSGALWNNTVEFLSTKNIRIPNKTIPLNKLSKEDFFTKRDSKLRVVRFGHSTVYLEIEGYKVLTDPIFSHRASPVHFVGPRRFHPTPITVEDLPEVDAVIISHNHYDHLDSWSIKKLHRKVKKFFVPLGIGRLLENWGVENSKITELNWWESERVEDRILIVATPARHFSGRRLIDNDKTFWNSWSIIGKNHRIFFSGDTGFFSEFADIGDKIGPFDITLLECGAYNTSWPHVHMFPEETLQAHNLLRGRFLCPIHWGTFCLSLHAWNEPVKRLLKASKNSDTRLLIPQIGEFLDYNKIKPLNYWWNIKK